MSAELSTGCIYDRAVGQHEEEERCCDCESSVEPSGNETSILDDDDNDDDDDDCDNLHLEVTRKKENDVDSSLELHPNEDNDNKLLSTKKASLSATVDYTKLPDDTFTTANESLSESDNASSTLVISIISNPSHDETDSHDSSTANENDENGIINNDDDDNDSFVSTEFSRRLDKLAEEPVDYSELYPAQSSRCYEADPHDSSTVNNDESHKGTMLQRAQSIIFTDHLYERLHERGLNNNDFYKALIHGRKCKEGGRWLFTFRGITAVTDESIKVGITIYEEACRKCRVSGETICERGFCTDCCWGCDMCAGERCRQCKMRGETMCGSRGYCIGCCYGCSECSCSQCKMKGRTICARGYCTDCCYGCYQCR